MIDYITIEIQYLLKNNQELQSYQLNPHEYFDLEENEIIDINSCPKYSHGEEYLKQNKDFIIDDLLFTKILLTDLKNKEYRQITERFWNNRQNKIIERIDMDLSKFQIIYNEIIIETLINVNPNKWEILRMERKEQIMQPIFHSFIEENLGQENEQEIIIDCCNFTNNKINYDDKLIKEIITN
ncbi:hypothetical protein [Cyanobacterium sp. Dongsha4]|uniref:hypothetical protein n=1 Tax=Cyanobacterium sp. DS4 TaxID=2878255 RepID=UPI002E821F6E|nr:hypothetical protein [Cyanobacterium sp. Dongsha4]WVL00278.1 hypothetical protein Dongsha4_16745 [Cyanobacterium sp. Dongsha4]